MTVKVELANGSTIDVASVEEQNAGRGRMIIDGRDDAPPLSTVSPDPSYKALKAQPAAEIGARYSTPVVLSKGPVGHRIPNYETVMRFGRRAGKAQEPMVLEWKIAKLQDQLDSIAIAKEAVTNAGDMEVVDSDTILVRRLKAVMEKLHEAYAYVSRGLADAQAKQARTTVPDEAK